MKKNYYEEINQALQSYENYKPYHTKTVDWICNRIDWCWKWRKISQDEMEELVNRIYLVLEGGI